MSDEPDIPSDGSGGPANKSGPLRDLAKAESMVQLALAVPAGCFVGLAIGYLLDRHFHTRWIVVAGMLLGAVGGFIQIFNFLSRSTKGGGQ
jgi:F0F1-type ATP synthase assembly protein I